MQSTVWMQSLSNSNGIFHRTRTKHFTNHMETQKTLNSQSSLEKEEWSWRNQPTWLQIILQSYSHQDSMVQAQRQKYIPRNNIENPERNPHSYGYFIFDGISKNTPWGKEYSIGLLQYMLLGKLERCMQNNEIRTLPNTMYKDKLKMDWRPKCKTWYFKTHKGKYRQNSLLHK